MLVGLFISFANCQDSNKIPKLQIGDFVYRLGHGFESQIIAYASSFKYSHIGYIVELNPTKIIHSTTDDDKYHKNQVIKSTLDDFIKNADSIAIQRVDYLSAKDKLQIAKSLAKRIGEPFVLLPKNQKNLYCTTLLEQEINKVHTFKPKYQYVDVALLKGNYLFPKSFYELNRTKIIYVSD